MKNANATKHDPITRSTSPPPPPTQAETIDELLRQSRRGIVPIRKTFVQQGHGKSTQPGPLASFIRSHDRRGLDLYLLVHAVASAPPWNCNYPSGTWARALGLHAHADPASARSAVSKAMKRLEDRGLVTRGRSGRRASVTLLREDGSRVPYNHPHESGDGPWLQLPHAYWLADHVNNLTLPAKAVLLIALSLPDGFYLPHERADDWYGISADSAGRGLRELRSAKLLRAQESWVRSEQSDIGWTQHWTYTLLGPYSPAARKSASTVRRKRSKTDKGGPT